MTDHSWEALVEVTGVNPTIGRGELNYALGQIRRVTEHLEDAELAHVIRHRAGLYRRMFPELPLTPPALAKWWDRLEPETARLQAIVDERDADEKRKVRRTNVHAENNCTTCRGNSYVVVGYRAPKQTVWQAEHGIEPKLHPSDPGFEETAPCPVCNTNPPVMRNYWDGRSWEYGSAPGELRIS